MTGTKVTKIHTGIDNQNVVFGINYTMSNVIFIGVFIQIILSNKVTVKPFVESEYLMLPKLLLKEEFLLQQ